MIKTIREEDWGKVQFDETPEIKEKVYQEVLQWIIEHRAFDGEFISQNDECQIYASALISKLADKVFKFLYMADE